jgi:hypothetical protein
MKTTIFSTLTMLAIAGTSLVSCNSDNPEATQTTTTVNGSSELAGTITDTKTLNASTTYTLTGTLVVENGGVLNIPAGTVIKAKKGFSVYILVAQGGKINVNGTASSPVVMKADIDTNESAYWGGLIINGKAKISGANGIVATSSTEIDTRFPYGGSDDNDNSGTIRYLILNNTGARNTGTMEHNGLTLDAVGKGTIIENVYVKNCADDGIEFFGGCVNVTNFFCVNTDDDMFDNTQGYRGTLTNIYGIWESTYSSTEADPRGVESDGNLDGISPNDINQTDFTINGMTIDLRLAPSTALATSMLDVVKIRRGSKATITNALVKGTGQAKNFVNFADGAGVGNAASTINIYNGLTAAFYGSKFPTASGIDYSVIVTEPTTANAGADKTAFAWTGYAF